MNKELSEFTLKSMCDLEKVEMFWINFLKNMDSYSNRRLKDEEFPRVPLTAIERSLIRFFISELEDELNSFEEE